MKILKVRKCEDCPKVVYVKITKGCYHYCSVGMEIPPPSREIKDINTIPDWCPLDDYKEADHEAPA